MPVLFFCFAVSTGYTLVTGEGVPWDRLLHDCFSFISTTPQERGWRGYFRTVNGFFFFHRRTGGLFLLLVPSNGSHWQSSLCTTCYDVQQVRIHRSSAPAVGPRKVPLLRY
ncbi:hypothetical protein K505DRAFT_15266 [Melanomma pulvis-pyrius CBS 109.77]|uniref:Secreted protein n=1 Tax=Melanomma pulvis-pyrius CBS 109.77 TaxID=1314802 RepID=A0A6A6XHZ8_9PLEO|nr:hypothetical protein K505DRAFT_15266 [Melanomma pulvis-pyrius CBS 109.77]